MADDKEIIITVRKNQEQGFRMLMAAYGEPVYWHVRRLVVSHADTQDAVQEAFLRIFRNFGQYRDGSSFRAWIFRIATNEALRLLGRKCNKPMLSLDDVTAEMLEASHDEFFDGSDAMAVKLQKAILHLPAKQQLTFNMRYYDDMSYEEIGTVAGTTAASAKMNYHLAKEKIIRFMNAND